jgi:hypothetical protein
VVRTLIVYVPETAMPKPRFGFLRVYPIHRLLQGWIIIGLLSLYVFIWLVFGIFGVEARPRRDRGQRGAAEAEGRGAQRRI